MPSCLTLLFPAWFVCAWIVSLASLGAEDPSGISLEVSRRLEAQGRTVVCVELLDPSLKEDSLQVRCRKYARSQELLLKTLLAGDCHLRYRYRYSPVVVLELTDPSALLRLKKAAGVKKVELDLEGRGGLLQSLQLTRANSVHQAGVEGGGTVAAVLDTGIDADNDNFEGAVIHQYHFNGAGSRVGEGAVDGNGHGSHVAGILASRGVSAPGGMAPAASLVVIKVLDDSNRGFASDWAMGVEHVIELHDADNGIRVDVINMSLETDSEYAGHCDGVSRAFSSACAAARSRGISVLSCGGNNGSTTRLTLPGCFASTTTVGSVWDTPPDRVSEFTNRTANVALMAPGQPILSVWLNGATRSRSGCSMAVPHVAGLYCLLREVDPAVSPEELDLVAAQTGVEVFDEATGLSFPRINAEAAVAQLSGNDCNGNGVGDDLDLAAGGGSEDCNKNGVPDSCDIAGGTSVDDDGDGIPDECFTRPVFYRGDTTGDGFLDLTDGISIFVYLFMGTVFPQCLDAADVDNNGNVDITDGVSLLVFLFAGGEPPPEPGIPPGDCGPDTELPATPGNLGCESYSGCQ